MNFAEWPEWLNPREVHAILVVWLGHDWARMTEVATVVVLVAALFVRFVLVPLGIVRKVGRG